MQKKLYLTAAIYYYYYLLHHILLQLYYKFPLKSNHILKLFTAKLEIGSRHKVHIPAWVWTFLQFRFIQTQHLTLLLLKDGSNCKVWMCIAVLQLWIYIGRCAWSGRSWDRVLLSGVSLLWDWKAEVESEILVPYMSTEKLSLISTEPEFHSSWKDRWEIDRQTDTN